MSENLSKLNSAFSSYREEELSHHSSSSTPLVIDKESQGEKGELINAQEWLVVVVEVFMEDVWTSASLKTRIEHYWYM